MLQLLVQATRTHCLCIAEEQNTVACVKQLLQDREGIPAAEFVLQWGGRILSDGPLPAAPATVRMQLRGLPGGKGGFGAMLRSMGKGAAGKQTFDFGACRDLNGRRLRHVNDEIRLKKWYEEQERLRKLKEAGIKAPPKVELTDTGIEGWYLDVPSWAEGFSAGKLRARARRRLQRKTELCSDWLEARKHGQPPAGAPRHWGCPRGPRCDFAHGEEELKVAGKMEVEAPRRQRWQRPEPGMLQVHVSLDEYLKTNDHLDEDMADAVAAGLRAAKRAKQERAAKDAAEKAAFLPVDEAGAHSGLRWDESSWLRSLAGELAVREEGEVEGLSEFGSACVAGPVLRRGQWCYEVELVTSGLMQVGWADFSFEVAEQTDGVGDHPSSWAFDGMRKLRWNGEDEGVPYGEKWKAGDVVGCLLDADTGTISFTLNGTSLGEAFTRVDVEGGGGLYPAFSVEQGEILRVNLGQRPLRFPPPLPFQPVWAGVTHNRASTAAAAAAVAASETAPSMDAALAVAAHSAEAAAVGGEHAAEGSTAFAAARPPAAKRRHKRDDAAASAAPQQQEAAPEQQQEQKQKQEQEQEPEQEPIDLDAVSNEAELVEMGLDRLKAALSARGLKCSGTAEERAARLFSVKGLSEEHYPPELRANTKKRRRR